MDDFLRRDFFIFESFLKYIIVHLLSFPCEKTGRYTSNDNTNTAR